jgi:HSP20 family molecular chaperone IbpA
MSTANELVNRTAGADHSPALIPLVDVFEDAAGITLTADMPGADKETLAIDVNGDTLTIDARFNLGEPANTQPTYTEVRAPHYRRSFTLSRDLDTSRIDAVLMDGVLNLRLHKAEAARPRRIEVRAA